MEERGKGTDNINISGLKLQHTCYADVRMLLNNGSLCQWGEVTRLQSGLRIQFSSAVIRLEQALFWVEWYILLLEMDLTEATKCIFASDLFRFVTGITNVRKMTQERSAAIFHFILLQQMFLHLLCIAIYRTLMFYKSRFIANCCSALNPAINNTRQSRTRGGRQAGFCIHPSLWWALLRSTLHISASPFTRTPI